MWDPIQWNERLVTVQQKKDIYCQLASYKFSITISNTVRIMAKKGDYNAIDALSFGP